ncbi:kinase-like protein, partial [Rhodotorula sp. JG-1b]
EDEVDLTEVTGTMLMRYRKDDLVRLCEERDIDHDGRKKAQLVDALLQWVSRGLLHSTLSNLSTDTARQETKTQALKAADHASARKGSSSKPLLMRSHHSASPEKPQTPEHSKVHEHQEDVNALDLESLQLQDKEIPPEQLEKLERIGSGGFKDVYKGKYRKRTIAICEIRGHLTDMDIKELGLLRDLHHTNVVQFIGISLPKPPSHIPVMIITELCANGDLFDYIRKTDPPPFTAMLDIMLGIARGIEYLHLHKPTIIHRDIKSSNVLISAQGVAKIADFGLARIKNSTQSMIRSLVGTVNWQAPELWHPHPRYNEKVDVYSAALVYWEVLQWHQPVKRYPFEGQNEHAIYHDVGAKNLRPPPGPLRRQWGGEIVDLMESMWAQDPAQRPSMTEVAAQLEKLKRERLAAKPGQSSSSKERR